MPEKPTPECSTFKCCGPEGEGGDPVLNYLKNRIDEWEEWIPLRFEDLVRLAWPEGIPRRRHNWSSPQRRAVSRFEGIPISMECYVLEAHRAGKESCNCNRKTAD